MLVSLAQVREKSSVGKVVVDEIAEFISGSYPNKESGIVYCFSRKECEQVSYVADRMLLYSLLVCPSCMHEFRLMVWKDFLLLVKKRIVFDYL